MNNVNDLEKTNLIKNVVIGYICSIIISIFLLLIYAVILANTGVQEKTITPVVGTIIAISVLIGSSISSLKIKKNGIVNGLSIGGIYTFTLYLLSSIFVTGFGINLKSILRILAGILFGGIGGIIGVNIKNK